VRRYHRDGIEFNYDSEWQHWIELESQKRLVEKLKTRRKEKEIKNWLWGKRPPRKPVFYAHIRKKTKPKIKLKVMIKG